MTSGDTTGAAPEARQDHAAVVAAPLPRLSLLRATSLMSGLTGHIRGYAEAAQAALPRGHGVAAEHASHLIDKIRGRVVTHLGRDNARCGPDRSVDGVLIQTKFCSSGRACIAECFDRTGFRCLLPNGSPMQIEVPRDLYDSAVQAMEHRIARGQVQGVADPVQARAIVRRGLLTYEQSRKLGRAGSRESLMFDAATGLRVATLPAALSAGGQLLSAVCAGERIRVAVTGAARAGAQSAGTAYVTHIITKQAARTALDRVLTPASEWVVGLCGSRLTKALSAAAGRQLLVGSAAAGHVAKVLRGNLVSAAATGLVLSSVELCRTARGKRTSCECAVNLLTLNTELAGGTAGWVGGVAAGGLVGSIFPLVGTSVGAFAEGAIGSIAGNAAGGGAALGIASLVLRERPTAFYVSEADNFVMRDETAPLIAATAG